MTISMGCQHLGENVTADRIWGIKKHIWDTKAASKISIFQQSLKLVKLIILNLLPL
jgi:hypothetical protein